MRSDEVSLTPHEFFLAASVGMSRQVKNLTAGRIDRYNFRGDGWGVHIEGACGEMAVAKYLNRYWAGNMDCLSLADVGKLQIRTRSRHRYDLIVHPEDPDGDQFILVTGLAPSFRVRGWILGRDAKQPQYWADPAGGRPAFFVPADDLISLVGEGVAA